METALEILGKTFLCGMGLGAGVLVVYAAWQGGKKWWQQYTFWHR